MKHSKQHPLIQEDAKQRNDGSSLVVFATARLDNTLLAASLDD